VKRLLGISDVYTLIESPTIIAAFAVCGLISPDSAIAADITTASTIRSVFLFLILVNIFGLLEPRDSIAAVEKLLLDAQYASFKKKETLSMKIREKDKYKAY
jgi:hypothetical protein